MNMLVAHPLSGWRTHPCRRLCHKSVELSLVKRLMPMLYCNAGLIIRQREDFGLANSTLSVNPPVSV
jgi:hypothetical protein